METIIIVKNPEWCEEQLSESLIYHGHQAEFITYEELFQNGFHKKIKCDLILNRVLPSIVAQITSL